MSKSKYPTDWQIMSVHSPNYWNTGWSKRGFKPFLKDAVIIVWIRNTAEYAVQFKYEQVVVQNPGGQVMTTEPNHDDAELREQLGTIKIGELNIDNGFHQRERLGEILTRSEIDRLADAILQLTHKREAAIRCDELERCMEQTEMERHENGYAVNYRFINDRIAELRRESDQAKEEK